MPFPLPTYLGHARMKGAPRYVPVRVRLIHGRSLADQLLDARRVPSERRPVKRHLPPRVRALHPGAPEQKLADHAQLAVSGGPMQRRAVAVVQRRTRMDGWIDGRMGGWTDS